MRGRCRCRAGPGERVGRKLRRVSPGRGHKLASLLFHGRGDALWGLQGIESEPADGADLSVVLFRVDLHYAAVFFAPAPAARRAAGGADRILLCEVPLPAVLPAVALHDGVHRTGVHAASAEGAARFLERLVQRRRHLGHDAAAHEVEDVRALLLADPHAPAAENTIVIVDGDEGALVIELVIEGLPAEGRLPDAEVRRPPLEATCSGV